MISGLKADERAKLRGVPLPKSLMKSSATLNSSSTCRVVLSVTFLLPPLSVQREIVAELEAERKLVQANRELIRRMEGRIKAKLDEVWGE
jgi:type I restriction enzyme M protein